MPSLQELMKESNICIKNTKNERTYNLFAERIIGFMTVSSCEKPRYENFTASNQDIKTMQITDSIFVLKKL